MSKQKNTSSSGKKQTKSQRQSAEEKRQEKLAEGRFDPVKFFNDLLTKIKTMGIIGWVIVLVAIVGGVILLLKIIPEKTAKTTADAIINPDQPPVWVQAVIESNQDVMDTVDSFQEQTRRDKEYYQSALLTINNIFGLGEEVSPDATFSVPLPEPVPITVDGVLLSGYNEIYTDDGCHYYEGDMLNGLFNGKGVYEIYSDSGVLLMVVNGEWKESLLTGSGKVQIYSDDGQNLLGDIDGMWESNVFVYGTISVYDDDGGMAAQYQADWTKGLFEATGTFTMFADNGITKLSTYTGRWNLFVPDGYGTFILYDDGETAYNEYTGMWRNGYRDGYGTETLYFEDGQSIKAQYTGAWDSDAKTGEGKLMCYREDGIGKRSEYNGTFIDGKLNGYGTLIVYYEDGTSIHYQYDGEWTNGDVQGVGTETEYAEDGRTIKWTYEGEHKDNLQNGKGKATYYEQDGKTVQYEHDGQWENNSPNGMGTRTRNSFLGSYLEVGQWKDGTLVVCNSQTLFYDDGSILLQRSGEFKVGADGGLDGYGTCVAYYENGQIANYYEGEFKNSIGQGPDPIIFYDESGNETDRKYWDEYDESDFEKARNDVESMKNIMNMLK